MREERIIYYGEVVYQKYTYGFIKCDKLVENTFFHTSQTESGEQIRRGDKVSFEVGEGRDGKSQALNVHLLRDEENYVLRRGD